MIRPLLAVGLTLLAACSSGGDAVEHQEPPVPVRVAAAERRDAPVELRAVGTVEAYSTVAVKAQVEGQLARVAFAEGQQVRRDDLLFTIDPRPFEAALRQAEANLARDRAQAEHARVEAARLGRLLAGGFVSKDEYERVRTQAESLAAALAGSEAAVERARLDLAYCSIRSPIDGRIGQLLVHEGNLIKAHDTTLAVIHQLQPLYVAFSVPQQNLADIRRYMAAGPLPVTAVAPKHRVAGELVFVNNAVDAATGTVLLKGLFANAGEELWPGQFVDVSLRLTTEPDAIVVPAAAVQTGQHGKYVFVVLPDGTVDSRPVVTGHSVDEYVVVKQGVAPGERVVTEGQLRLAPGARVEIRDGTA